jgi:opacity protein-like surface antigen
MGTQPNSTLESIMQTKRMRMAVLLLRLAALAAFVGTAASAQVDVAKSLSHTDIGVSVYGAFSGATSGNNVVESPSNSAGGMIELRHIVNPIFGYEGTYSFNRGNQNYTSCPSPFTPLCEQIPVLANAHEVTGDWVASLKIANLRPFALVGVGFLFDVPVSGQTGTTINTKPLFVYGAGLDWGLLPHLGIRGQYRGNLYKAPDLTTAFTSTGAFTHTAEPMIGAYFRF